MILKSPDVDDYEMKSCHPHSGEATQFFELPSYGIRGGPKLRNKKWLNSNLTCGTNIGDRSGLIYRRFL
jgi:hypothetical protein